MTSINSLPSVIKEPGVYVTRSGKKVTIHEIRGQTNPDYTEFLAKGFVWRKLDRMGTNPQYNVWHVSGRFISMRESQMNITGKPE